MWSINEVTICCYLYRLLTASQYDVKSDDFINLFTSLAYVKKSIEKGLDVDKLLNNPMREVITQLFRFHNLIFIIRYSMKDTMMNGFQNIENFLIQVKN